MYMYISISIGPTLEDMLSFVLGIKSNGKSDSSVSILVINTTSVLSHSLRNTSLDSEKKWTGNERSETFFNWKEIK